MPARDVAFVQERWTLTVTFDRLKDQSTYSDGEFAGVDEAFRFARYAGEQCGGLWEEFREMIKWPKGSRTVTVTADVLDYLVRLMNWVTMNAIPVSIRLIRNDKERGV